MRGIAILSAILLVAAGCARELRVASTPAGASVERLVRESRPAVGVSFGFGMGISSGGVHAGPRVGAGVGSTSGEVRKVVGFTPLTLSWVDDERPENFLTIKQGDAWVIVYPLADEPAIVVDFTAEPIRVRGARLVDANRPAEQLAPATGAPGEQDGP